MSKPLLEVSDLTIQYATKEGPLTAVSNVSFTVNEGEYFGLVGESGCGKSTVAKALIGALDKNARITSGSITYRGEEIQDLSESELNERLRWKEISWIPQSSMNSLDPLQRVSDQAIEIGRTHTDMSKQEILDRFREMFRVVGIQESRISDYPHQFSGGMQQRAIIALALFLEPALLIADEPTTALDVIMQDQILKYLDKVRETTDASMVKITHDISVIMETCDKVSVMHAGQLAETASVKTIYDTPRHPYSIMLQEAFPDYRYPDRRLAVIEGNPPQNMGEVNYCTYESRCPWATDECRNEAPPLQSVGTEDGEFEHFASCFNLEAVANRPRDNSRGRAGASGRVGGDQ